MSPHTESSETSPLLGEAATGNPKVVIENGVTADGATTVADDPETQQTVDATRESQFEGNPEVRKKLKLILPALSIGVSVACTAPRPL